MKCMGKVVQLFTTIIFFVNCCSSELCLNIFCKRFLVLDLLFGHINVILLQYLSNTFIRLVLKKKNSAKNINIDHCFKRGSKSPYGKSMCNAIKGGGG